MYHVSAQGVDERMIKVHYYYYCLRCLVLWRGSWSLNDWTRFPLASCILVRLYYNMTAAVRRQHHLPGQRSLSALWTAQTQRPSLSTRGWAGVSSPVYLHHATVDCSISSHVWVCKRLALASALQHLSLWRRNRPAQFSATSQNCLYNTIHIQGEQLHEAHPVFPCTVVYLRRCGLDSINVCHCDRWLRPRTVCQYTDT